MNDNPNDDPYADEKKYDDNGLPTIVFRPRKPKSEQQPSKRGLTQKMRTLAVGGIMELGDYNRKSIYALALQIGIKVIATTGGDGKVYIRRES